MWQEYKGLPYSKPTSLCSHYLMMVIEKQQIPIWLFRIISIPSKFCYFRLPDHVISMELLALNFRCQCTQQKLQSICANMEMPRKPLNKYWCSVPHYLSDIRNIYIKADRFPLMMLTAANKEKKQLALNFRCQCTQQKLQSICAVLTFDPQL
jgi:hypothetical protein